MTRVADSQRFIGGPEVEDALLRHPAVAECGVIGKPDDERGMIVKAFCVLKPGYATELNGVSRDFETRSGFVPRTGIIDGTMANRFSFYGRPDALVQQLTTFITVQPVWRYEDFPREVPKRDIAVVVQADFTEPPEEIPDTVVLVMSMLYAASGAANVR